MNRTLGFLAVLLAAAMGTVSMGCSSGGSGQACTPPKVLLSGQCVERDSGTQRDAVVNLDTGTRDTAVPVDSGGMCQVRFVPQGTDGKNDPSFAACGACGRQLACVGDRANSCSLTDPNATSGTPRCYCGGRDQCPSGQTCVSNNGTWQCSAPGTPLNCGGVQCNPGESCSNNVCTCGGGAACGAGSGCCNNACVNLQTDTANCGACAVACGANAPRCNAGSCGCGTGAACEPSEVSLLSVISGANLGQVCTNNTPTGTCQDATNSNCNNGMACANGTSCIADVDLAGALSGNVSGSGAVCCGSPILSNVGSCGGCGLFDLGDILGGGGLPF